MLWMKGNGNEELARSAKNADPFEQQHASAFIAFLSRGCFRLEGRLTCQLRPFADNFRANVMCTAQTVITFILTNVQRLCYVKKRSKRLV